jgi:4'-phosphopantetheinyl transferase
VWRIELDLSPASLARAYEVLSTDERHRADRYRLSGRRHRFVSARGVLRAILGSYLGVPAAAVRLGLRPSGRPFLRTRDDDPIDFNLAHSGNVALVAVTRGRSVGVDIERFRRGLPYERIADRFFADREVAALREIPKEVRPAAFFACWTRKEAYLKARDRELAMGLPAALSRFSIVSLPGESISILSVPGRPKETTRWSLVDVNVGAGFAGALAVEGRATPRFFDWIAPPR